MTALKPTRGPLRLTADQILGTAGVCLAAASAAFGIGMTLHGPDPTFATAKDFTVFAQLATRRGSGDGAAASRGVDRVGAGPDGLDMTATASIPKTEATGPVPGDGAIIPSVTLEAVGSDSATVAVGGRTRVVRVGDDVPGAGEVVAILPGPRPFLRTSRGVIAPATE